MLNGKGPPPRSQRATFHFHMLWLDGVYEANDAQPQSKPRLHRARAPTSVQLTELAGKIAHRV